jgi:sugar lactone lactonase YvrE
VPPRTLTADPVTTHRAELGEGPRWDGERGELLSVDIVAGEVHRDRPEGGRLERVDTYDAGAPVGVAVPAATGGWVLGRATGFALLEETGTVTPLADTGEDPVRVRFNDGGTDPAGRFIAGTLAYDEAPGAGALWRLRGEAAEKIRPGATVPNGLDWSPDGGTAYWADSGVPVLLAFPYDADTGALGEPRELTLPGPDGSVPDGLTVDAEGALWIAYWGGGEVRRYMPDGRHLATVAVPAAHTTSCCIGGTTLYITSARFGRSQAELAAEPHAGRSFAVDVGVTAPAVTPWIAE